MFAQMNFFINIKGNLPKEIVRFDTYLFKIKLKFFDFFYGC